MYLYLIQICCNMQLSLKSVILLHFVMKEVQSALYSGILDEKGSFTH